MPTPPSTTQRNTSYELHDTVIKDQFLWLENDDKHDDAISAWVDSQNEYVTEYLANVDVRDRLRPRFEQLAQTTSYGSITTAPTGYFQELETAVDDQPILYFRESLADDREVIVDPNEFSDDGTASLGWWTVSPDGELLAYGVSEGGDEQYDIEILNVQTGDIIDTLPDLGRSGAGAFAWTSDGVYYQQTGDVGGGGQLQKSIHFHEFGTDVADDERIYEVDEPSTSPVLRTNRDADHLIIALVTGWDHNDLLYKHTDDDEFTPVITDADHFYRPVVNGDTVFLQTDYKAPNYRIAALDLTAGVNEIDPDELEEVVPERESILNTIEIADNRLLAQYECAAVSELERFTLTGEHEEPVPVPEFGSITQVNGDRNAPEAFFQYQSFTHPPTVFKYDLSTGETDQIDQVDVNFDFDLTVEQIRYESADGVEIPMFIVHRADLELDGTNPALLYGYGGFGINMTPGFLKYESEFLRQGGIYAKANLRGGEEFGTEWHQAARHEKKQTTFDDMIAAAKTLIEDEYTSRERLAVRGGSNGGLTVGAMVTQRPDLIRAAVCRVPLLDMLRFHKFLLGEAWTSEYGSPDDPDAYEWLREYSPYHNVEKREYPAVLFETAESDTRVHPVHAWKMTARLQQRNTSEHPILCKTSRNTGHGMGKPTWMVVEEQLDRWSFIFEELDVEVGEE